MADVILIEPNDQTVFVYDWSGVLGTATVTAVTHTVPSPLILMSEGIQVGNLATYVKLRGGVHGGECIVTSQVTLSTGEILSRGQAFKVFAGAA
jgi:hypothetical protein